MSTKLYELPEDVNNLRSDASALIELRDAYVKLPFGFKKARKCAIDNKRLLTLFWFRAVEIYPELSGKNLVSDVGGVRIRDDKA